jgi:hypothetical protein
VCGKKLKLEASGGTNGFRRNQRLQEASGETKQKAAQKVLRQESNNLENRFTFIQISRHPINEISCHSPKTLFANSTKLTLKNCAMNLPQLLCSKSTTFSEF